MPAPQQPSQNPAAARQTAEPSTQLPTHPPTAVVVKDIDVPIGSLVLLQFKLLVAAIPVALVVLLVAAIVRSAMNG